MKSCVMLLVSVGLLSICAPMATAQSYLNFGKNGAQAAQTAPATSAAGGQSQAIPNYVEPSRFYYNQPSALNGGQLRYPRPNYQYYNYGRRGFYRPDCNYYRWPRAAYYGYYGGPVYNYGNIPGATVHLGPFIPF